MFWVFVFLIFASYVSFFYLTGPIQLALINPIAFYLLEGGEDEKRRRRDGSGPDTGNKWVGFLKQMKKSLLNPIGSSHHISALQTGYCYTPLTTTLPHPNLLALHRFTHARTHT